MVSEATPRPIPDPFSIGFRSFFEAGRLLLARTDLLRPTVAAWIAVLVVETVVFFGIWQFEPIVALLGEDGLARPGSLTFVVGGAVLLWVAAGNLVMAALRPMIARRLEALLRDPDSQSASQPAAGVSSAIDLRTLLVAARDAAFTFGALAGGIQLTTAKPWTLVPVGLGCFLLAGLSILDASWVGATPPDRSARWSGPAWRHRRLVGGFVFSHLLLCVVPFTFFFVLPLTAVSGVLLRQRIAGAEA